MKQVFILFLVSLTLYSCGSKELSRNEAKGLIAEKLTSEKLVRKFKPDYKNQRLLKSLGYLTWTERKEGAPWYRTLYENYQVTGDAVDYLIDQKDDYGIPIYYFNTGSIEFGEILGIINLPEEQKASVEYTLRHVPNDFGKKAFRLKEEIKQKKATFIRYDDGWRLNK